MNLTPETIKAELLAEFKDKKVGYSTYDVDSAIGRVVRAAAEEAGLNPLDFSASKSKHSNWTVDITYKRHTIGGVDIKRSKGKTHYNWFGSSTDYCYKDFCVWLAEDLDKEIAEIDASIARATDREAARLALAKGVFAEIKKQIGAKDDYEVRSFIEYMNKVKYSLA